MPLLQPATTNKTLKSEIKARSIADHLKEKNLKLQAQFISSAASAESDLLSKFTFFIVNDSKERMGIEREFLKDLIKRHSGKFCHYYQPKKVTHVVAIEIPPLKRKIYYKKIIVKPQWIIECVKQKKIVPDFAYRVKEPQNGNFVQLTLNSQFGLEVPSPAEREEKKASDFFADSKERSPFNIANSPVYLSTPPSEALIELERMFTKHEWDKMKILMRQNSRLMSKEAFEEQLEFVQRLFASKSFTLKLW